MTTPATPTPQPDPAPTPPDHAEFYRDALHGLIGIAMKIARKVEISVDAQPDPAPPAELADLAESFERTARTVRRTINLARHLDDATPTRAQHRAAARRHIIREVEDAIQRADPDEEESLKAELYERLDSPDLDDDIQLRPAIEIAANVRRDLGLNFHSHIVPYKRRTPADIAELCARAAARPAQSDAAGPERLFRLIAAPNRN